MLDTVAFWAVVGLHLMLCAVVYLFMRLRLLLVRPQMIVMVVLVPFWGVVCVLLMHMMRLSGREGSVEAGVEKLQENADIYRSLLVEDLNMQKSVVPLQEALILNDAQMRRGMMLDVLYENPDDYFELLDEARDNEDGEVVHYATTAMAELAKEYDFRLQQFERAYALDPKDPQLTRRYCDFLGQYLAHGLIEGQMLQVQRGQYALLLEKCLKQEPRLSDYATLVHTRMQLGEFLLAGEAIDTMECLWPEAEETLLARLEYAVRQKDGDSVRTLVRRADSDGRYLSVEARKKLNFFEGAEGAERDLAI